MNWEFPVSWYSCQILCNTFSNTVETKIQRKTETASNCLAGKKKKILFSQDFADYKKKMLIYLSIRSLNVLLLGILFKKQTNKQLKWNSPRVPKLLADTTGS